MRSHNDKERNAGSECQKNNIINFLKICRENRINGIIETKGKELNKWDHRNKGKRILRRSQQPKELQKLT